MVAFSKSLTLISLGLLVNTFTQFDSFQKINLFVLTCSFIHFDVKVFRLERLIFLNTMDFMILVTMVSCHNFIHDHILWLALRFMRIMEFELARMAHHIFVD